MSEYSESASDNSQLGHNYNKKTGVLNSRETGKVHHLLPPSRQKCEVDGHMEAELDPFMDIEPVGPKPYRDRVGIEKQKNYPALIIY